MGVYRDLYDCVHVYVYVVYEGFLGTPILFTFQTKIFLPVLCFVQNEIKYSIVQFMCETQNKRKGMIAHFFPLNSAYFLVSCQMDLVFPFLVKNHCVLATKWFKPVQFAWRTSSRNVTVLWAVLCECSDVFQSVDTCPHCVFTLRTVKPYFILPLMSAGHLSSSLIVTQQGWQATGAITSSKTEWWDVLYSNKKDWLLCRACLALSAFLPVFSCLHSSSALRSVRMPS